MKQLDIRFAKEHDSKKAAAQAAIMEQLKTVLPKRIEERFSGVNVRIRLASSQGFEISGFTNKTEKDKFTEYLEELWNDSTLIEYE